MPERPCPFGHVSPGTLDAGISLSHTCNGPSPRDRAPPAALAPAAYRGAFAVTLLIALLATAAPPALQAPANLDFAAGTLQGWEGDGFYVTTATGKGPSLASGVCSSDMGRAGRKAMLHRTFVVPPNAGVLRCVAHVRRPKEKEDDGKIDILLMAAGRLVLPKAVRASEDWQPVNRILPPQNGRPREYLWDVSNYVGQTLRLALIDDDARPGCHLFCGGFRIISRDEHDGREFCRFMVRLTNDHKLPPVARFESKHFMALSNADDAFTEARVQNCELIYELFFDHFGRRGFRLHEPAGKLMVAIFDGQSGFEAYLGRRMPAGVTGIYHTKTNRLVVYDFGRNDSFIAARRQMEQEGRRIGPDLERMRFLETANRRAKEFRTGINVGTIMHEVAHQLSFNTGLLNRDGDMPAWLAEGLACYCEATDHTTWQGIGEANPERIGPLAAQVRGNKPFIPLRDLVAGDGWLRGAHANEGLVLLGYAQSWALFRMLMDERPEQLRAYLRLIWPRRSEDHRLTDFGQAFGADLGRLDLRYNEYMKEVVEQNARRR